jgi:hypothetical protein
MVLARRAEAERQSTARVSKEREARTEQEAKARKRPTKAAGRAAVGHVYAEQQRELAQRILQCEREVEGHTAKATELHRDAKSADSRMASAARVLAKVLGKAFLHEETAAEAAEESVSTAKGRKTLKEREEEKRCATNCDFCRFYRCCCCF